MLRVISKLVVKDEGEVLKFLDKLGCFIYATSMNFNFEDCDLKRDRAAGEALRVKALRAETKAVRLNVWY